MMIREFIAHELPKLGYLDWKPITKEVPCLCPQ